MTSTLMNIEDDLNIFLNGVGGNGGSKSHIKWDFVGQNCVGYMWWCVGWF